MVRCVVRGADALAACVASSVARAVLEVAMRRLSPPTAGAGSPWRRA